MLTKLSKHRWSLTCTPDRTRCRLLCNGKAFPANGPIHTVDFRRPETPLERTTATYTDFRTGEDIRLVTMTPIIEPEKKLDARTWWKEQSGFMRRVVKDWINDRLEHDHILQIMDASMYANGFRAGSFDWLID